MKKPNCILIITDQMRGDALGCYGHPAVQSANIDYLAARGTRFEHAYSAVPSCIPARATLWTGQNQWSTGILGMGRGQGPMPNDYPHTIAGELTRAGYRTHMVGKGHFHPSRSSMGFESTEVDESGRMERDGLGDDDYRRWFKQHAPAHITPDDHGVFWNSWHARPWHTEESFHPTWWTMRRAIDFLDTRDRSRPFFLNISFARPHSPYVPPAWYFDLYDRKDLPAPDVGEWASMHDDPAEAADPNAWRGRMNEQQIHRARAGYYGEISFIDQQIGRLLSYLFRFDREAYDNTWFVFVSDHGDMLGDHNLWRKTYAYEGSARVPLIVTPPKHSQGDVQRVSEHPVELRDLMPTILEAADVDVPSTVDGASLLPLCSGQETPWRSFIHGEHCWCYGADQEMQYVTDGKRKFVWLPRIGVRQFFDLEEDPGELSDLIDDPDRSDEVAKWESYLATELEKRNCGWSENGSLAAPPDEPLVSPWKGKRRTG